MAVVTYGHGIVDMRGPVGGGTHSRNLASSFIRTRTKPTNPISALSSLHRNIFATVQKSWGFLLDTERDAWRTAAPSGISGFNLYCGYNMNAYKTGSSNVTVPPLPGLINPIGALTWSIDTGAGTAVLSWISTVIANNDIYFALSSPVPPGTIFNKKYMRGIGAGSATGTTGLDVWDGFQLVNGADPVPGQRYYISLELFHLTQLNFLPAQIVTAVAF